MGALSRIDSLAAIAGPAAERRGARPGDRSATRTCAIARESVVRISGYACGLGIEGSGWVAAPGWSSRTRMSSRASSVP